MSDWTTPTTKQLSDNIVAQMSASLNQSIPLLPKSFIRVLAKAIAAVTVILYKYAGFIFLQMFVRYASDQPTTLNGQVVTPLREWGTLIGVGDPIAATQAEMTIDITVTIQTGTLAAGAQLFNSNNGFTYVTTSAVTLDAAVKSVGIRAVNDQNNSGGLGTAGNLSVDTLVSFANPLANVSRNAVVTAQTVTAADAETTAHYRQRILDRFQKRPQGGAAADYEEWGETVAGIAAIYPYAGLPGHVNVYMESATEPDGIPTAAQLSAVLAAINLDVSGRATRRPISSYVNSLPITRVSLTIGVEDLAMDEPTDDPEPLKAEITDAINTYVLSCEPFIDGLSVLPRKDRISANTIAGIVQNIVNNGGATFTGITITKGVVPYPGFYPLGEGEKAKVSLVTW
jgi:uncharacterized phage protein gp47/JayE